MNIAIWPDESPKPPARKHHSKMYFQMYGEELNFKSTEQFSTSSQVVSPGDNCAYPIDGGSLFAFRAYCATLQQAEKEASVQAHAYFKLNK